jgi:cobaltochelatase CobS
MTTQATTSAGTGQKGRKKASPAPTPAPQAVAGAGLAEEQVQPQWVQHDAYQAFGVELMRGKTMIGLSAPSAFTPAKDPTYKWPMENLRDLAYFYVAGGNAFCAMGHPGTGKTAGVQQFHAALNLPLLCMSANPRTQAYHLIGRLVPNQEGGVSWSDGPVLMAARLGMSVLIDEYNVIDPGEMTGLNLLRDGRIWFRKQANLLFRGRGFASTPPAIQRMTKAWFMDVIRRTTRMTNASSSAGSATSHLRSRSIWLRG